MSVIGRSQAKQLLTNRLKNRQSDLVAVIGRRRIGKTYLIHKFLKDHIVFQYTGLYRGTMHENLERFSVALQEAHQSPLSLQQPTSWFEAFDQLKYYIGSIKSPKKKVIFLDEFPWMATNRSRFLTAFTDWWNTFASERRDLLVIICGSSASWMINKVLKNKGGLHNRVTARLFLEPFTLGETREFLRYKGITLTNHEIIKLYMAIGGVPFYLDQLDKGESTVQAIDRLCFTKGGLLRDEYNELMVSLFDNSTKHQAIIDVLNQHPQGLLRNTIIDKTKLQSGGGTTHILEELETSGFILSQVPYLKKAKDRIYKVRDPYLAFYYKFIKDTKPSSKKGVWPTLFTSASYTSWTGLAFENLCLQHIDKIKEALKIDGIQCEYGTWHNKGDKHQPVTQIDLLIDRADAVINMCELKFYNTPLLLSKNYANELRQRISIFQTVTGTKKAIFPTMVTSYGLLDNAESDSLIQQSVTADRLF